MTAPQKGLLDFADSVSAPLPAAAAPAETIQMQLVTFSLDREEFGIPISQVREVIRVGELTRVPESPEHIRGVTNLRGRILPVVELRSRLGLPRMGEPGVKARIVVVESQGRTLGLLVDAVHHVLKVPASSMIEAPAEVVTAQGNYVTGVARMDARLVILLDLDRALRLA